MQLDHGGTIVSVQGLTLWQGARSIMNNRKGSQGRYIDLRWAWTLTGCQHMA